MSKHSKKNTSSTIFTYAERQKLKNVYGTIETRLGQDSFKKIQMCTICQNFMIQPCCCLKGHTFCRPCIIEYLVQQKKKNAEQKMLYKKQLERQDLMQRQKKIKNQLNKMQEFQKYDTFTQITQRHKLLHSQQKQFVQPSQVIDKCNVKPIGIYELNDEKDRFIKQSFWAIENTPEFYQKLKKQNRHHVDCAGGKHRIRVHDLRNLKCQQLQGCYGCWICHREIRYQQIGAYKCGHLICKTCKSNHCQICQSEQEWINIENTPSSFSSHKKSNVKIYTHAFMP